MHSDTDVDTLLGFVWADQIHRIDRLRSAVGIARKHPVALDTADGAEWIESVGHPVPSALTVALHTVITEHMTRSMRDVLAAAIARIGNQAADSRPFAWLRMEQSKDAYETILTVWPGFKERCIARSDGHGNESTLEPCARMKILFACGGTGGHLYPAIALADALRERAGIRFVGTADRLETSIVPGAGYELQTVAARPLRRAVSIETVRTAGANALGILQSARILSAFSPDVIVATGGYVGFPVMVAAKMLRAAGLLRSALALLEPNAQPGLTNRLLAPLVDEIWGAFESPARAWNNRFVRTGIPVRSTLFSQRDRVEAARRLGLDAAMRTLLVMGGSQGARSINTAVTALVAHRALPPDWQVLHVSGERDYASVQAQERTTFAGNRVVLMPYIADMADAYALADLVIARAGASTLGELAALGIASVLVPYPFASDDHQMRNARAFQSAGACIVLGDRALDEDSLRQALHGAMEPANLARMRRAARSLAPGDPVAAILARIDALASRKTA